MTDITNNRKIAISALKDNPKRYKQGTNALLVEPDGARCALGVMADALGIELSPAPEPGEYDEIERSLGLDDSTYSYIWQLNDADKLTFNQIGDALIYWWDLDL